MLIRFIFILLGLIPAAVTDKKKREIPNLCLIPILLSTVLYMTSISPADIFGSAILTVLLFLLFIWIAVKKPDEMGGGDMKLILSLTLAHTYAESCLAVLICSAAALVYSKLRKEKHIPLAPFLLLGFGLTDSASLFYIV